MSKITKAVIPCGGMGTRFLPITKAVPKEILPVIDTPVLGHIVNEAIESGITDILIVLGDGKDAIKNYFTDNKKLESKLIEGGKNDALKILRNINGGANISFATQKEPLGSGDALLYAEKFTGKEPFMLAWGDDLMYSKTPVMGQLMKAFEILESTILGVQHFEGNDIVKYGVAALKNEPKQAFKNAYLCSGIVEKPALSDIPSRLASLGRYILLPDVYDVIRATPKGKNNELQLTDALNTLCLTSNVYAFDFEGIRYDMGDKFGSVKAIVEYALRSKEYSESMKNYILELAKKL